MKKFTFISAILLSLQFINAQAAVGYTCQDLSGDIPPPIAGGIPGVDLGLYFNPNACAIITAARSKYFPDIVLQAPFCFTTKFQGNLGSTPVIAVVNSGIIQNYNTVNGFNYFNGLPDMTAATTFTFNKLNSDGTVGRNLGTVYTRDLTNDVPDQGSNPREFLSVVDGTLLYDRARGAFVIEGDAALGAPIKGRLCFLGS